MCLCGRSLASPSPSDFCAKVLTFEVTLPESTNTSTLDTEAETVYGQIPRWVTQDCLAAALKLSCMSVYGPYASDGAGYCKTSCLDTITNCSETISALSSYSTLVQTDVDTICLLKSTSNSGCHSGGHVKYSDIPDGWGSVCPLPLHIPESGKRGVVHSISGTNCALPCPSVAFSRDVYQVFREYVRWCTLCGMLCSATVLLFYLERKHILLQILCVSIFLFSLTAEVFLLVDDNYPQVCEDATHFLVRQPFCVFQGTVSIILSLWISLLQVMIVVQLWASAVLELNVVMISRYRSLALKCGACVSVLAGCICAAASDVGFDWEGDSGPICLFLQDTTQVYFWVIFFCPVSLIVITCWVLLAHTIVHINGKLAGSTARSHAMCDSLYQMFKLNKRMVFFIVYFSSASFFILVLIIDNNVNKFMLTSATSYYACLLENTVADANTGLAVCGASPLPGRLQWRISPIILYASSLGIMCFAVYGTQGKLPHTMSKRFKKWKTTMTRGPSTRTKSSTGQKDPEVNPLHKSGGHSLQDQVLDSEL